MRILSNRELNCIYGGSIKTSFDYLFKIFRIINIRLMMEILFID